MTTWDVLKRGALVLLVTAGAAVAQPEVTETAAEIVAVEAVQTDSAATPIDWVLPEGQEVSGEVSGFWDRGVYHVTDVLTVPAGDSLFIAAGCTLYFRAPIDRNNLHINALGYLSIAGTDSVPVVMMSALPPDDPKRIWGGVLYVGNRAEGRIDHTIFHHAEIGIQIREGVRADNVPPGDVIDVEPDTLSGEEPLPEYILRRPTGPVTISNSIVEGASFTGIVLVGVDSSVVIDSNRIESCSNGISIENRASPIIRENLILNNTSAGIVCSNNSNPYIDRTTVIGSATAGIICSNSSSPFVTESVIAKNGIGISTTNSSPTIQNCTIAKNDFSGIIAYEAAHPRIARSNLCNNGLAGIDNRSTGDIVADRIWWGYIVTDRRPAPVIDASVRRARGEQVDANTNGSVIVTNSLDGPSVDAPGTPDQVVSLTLASTSAFDDPDPIATVTNGDTLWIRMVAVDESPYLEDQGVIIITSSSGDPEGTQRVLNESGPNTGTYEGYVIASLVAGDPNIVVEVQNGDQIRVTTGTTTPITQSVTFVSEPPIVSRLRVNGEVRGARLIDPTPTFSWQYIDPENDPQAATQLELSTDPAFSTDPFWRHEETGRLLEYMYDGPSLQRGTTYYLRVRANDSYNWGQWRETSFHMNIAPPTPTLRYPENGAVITSGSGRPELAVNNVVDADGDPVSYVFQAFYGEDFSNTQMQARGGDAPVPEDPNRDETVWKTVPMLWENSTIWWRAKATDGLEDSDWSAPRSFLLNVQDDPPNPFNMLDPRRDSTVLTIHPRFEWEHTYDPDPDESIEFVLTIARDSLFTDIAQSYTVEPRPEPIQYFQVPQPDSLLDNTYYYWKVVAIQDGEVLLVANEEDDELPNVWKFFVDTGNDPPYFLTIPRVTMQEDTPYRVRVGRYIVDPDNTLDQITVTARGSQNIAAEVVGDKEILLTPKRDWFGGPETIRLEAQDPLHSIGIGEIIVSVVNVNDPPTIQSIPAQTVAEDTDLRLDLNPFADDIDNRVEELTWRAEYDRTKLQITIERGVATIRGTQDFYGENIPVRFVVTDPGGFSAATSTAVTVTPVNDAPRVEQIPTIVFDENTVETVNLRQYVTDPDDPTPTLVWTAQAEDPISVEIDPSTHIARISAPEHIGGIARRITFTVQDPHGLSNQIVAQVQIRDVNDPPVIAAIPPQTFKEDESLTLELDQYVSDPDNAAREMTWSATPGPNVRIAIDPQTRRATFSAPPNWYGGPETIRFTVRDPGGLTATQTVQVTVESVPEAPQFRTIPQVTFNEDETTVVALDDYLSDPDHPNARLRITVTSGSNIAARLNESTRTITLSAPPNWYGGPETITVEAVDPDNERAQTTFTVRVLPVNDPPVLATIPPVTFDEDLSTTVTLTDYVTDPDNTPAEMKWAFAGAENVRVNLAAGVATFSAAHNWNGTERIRVTVTDPGGLTATGTIVVTVRPVNDPPVLATIPPVAFDEDTRTTLNLAQYVSDPDNEFGQLTWTVTGAQNVRVNISGTTATFTAAPDWHGAERVTFTVSDPGGLQATQTVQVTVRPVNDPPQISAIPAVRFDEDESTSIDLSQYGSDVDGDPLQWTASSPNPNLRVSVNGSVLTISAAENWFGGPISVAVTATDPSNATVNATVQVSVNPVNDPPVLSTIPPVTFDEDTNARMDLNQYVTDPDDTPAQLTWTATGAQNIIVNVVNGTATFSAPANWHGAERVTLTVRDRAGAEASQVIQVTVNRVNDPPTFSRIPPVVFEEDGSTSVDLSRYASDPDGDSLTFSATSNDQNLRATVRGSTLNLSATENWFGTAQVTVTATDPARATATATIAVTVTPVNDEPELRPLPAVTFNEDETATLDLASYVTDVEDAPAEMNWSASGAQNVQVRFSGTVATFSARANWHGTERVTITVRDRGGASKSQTVQVTVNPVNDPPVVNVSPINMSAGETRNIDLNAFASDPDGDTLRWSYQRQTGALDVRLDGSVLRITAPAGSSGTSVITLTVSDGKSGEETVRLSVNVNP